MKPIKVRGSYRHTLIEGSIIIALLLLPLLGIIAWVVSTFPGMEPKDWLRLGLIMLAIEAPFWLLAGLVAVVQRRRQIWLEMTPHGFILRGPQDEREYAFETVREMTCSTRHKRSLWGLILQTRCELRVEENGERNTFHLSWEYQDPGSDPLKTFIDRIGLCLKETALEELAHGGVVCGQGWELNSVGLSVPRGDGEILAYDDLAAVALYGEQLRIWRRGRKEPVFAVRADSPNIQTLRWVLLERIQPRPEEPCEGMGLLLFEDKPTGAGPLWVFCGGLILLFSFISVSLLSKGVWIGSGIFLLIAMTLLWPAWNLQRRLFQCYELGLIARNGLGTRQLRFQELADCSFETRAPNTGPSWFTPLGLLFSLLFSMVSTLIGLVLILLLRRSPKNSSSESTPLGRRRLLLSLASSGQPLPQDFRVFVAKYQSSVTSSSSDLILYFRDQVGTNQLIWETDMTLNTVPLLTFMSRITDFVCNPLHPEARIAPQQLEEQDDFLANRCHADSLPTEEKASQDAIKTEIGIG
jgi:hypothetical protein